MSDPVQPPSLPQSRRPGYGRLGARLLNALLLLVTGFMGAMGIGLALGPVSLGPVARYLIGAVGETVPGYRLTASDALLSWSSEQARLVIKFVDPRVVDMTGAEMASANDIAVSFSVQALLAGDVAPRSLTITGPTATFTRLADGGFDIGIRSETRRGTKVKSTETDATPFVKALLEAPHEGKENTYLEEIILSNSTLTFIDEMTDSIVKAPRGTLVVRRTAEGLAATLDGQVSLPKGNWQFSGSMNYERGDSTFLVEGGIANARLDALADAGPLFEGLAGVSAPLSASFNAEFSTDGNVRSVDAFIASAEGDVRIPALSNLKFHVENAQLDVNFDSVADKVTLHELSLSSDSVSGLMVGTFALRRDGVGNLAGWASNIMLLNGRATVPGLFDGDTVIDDLTLKADNDLVKDELTLQALDISSAGAALNFHGAVSGLLAQRPAVKMTGAIHDLPIDRLGTLWPQGLAQGARDWVLENMKGGRISEGVLAADIPADQIESGIIADDAMRFQLNFINAAMTYVGGLPPLTDVKGAATVTGNHFDAQIDTARVGALQVDNGKVSIDDLNVTGTPANIAVHVSGAVADVLWLIDHKPLGYPSRYGLNPKLVGGSADIQLGLIVPTLKALKVEDIGFDIKTELSGVSMPVSPTIHLKNGNARFLITGDGLTAEGKGDIAGVTANFKWGENFKAKSGEAPTTFSANAIITEEMRRNLGVDPGKYLDGDAGVEVSMTGRGFDPVTATARVELDAAALNVPELGYAKKAGEPALMTAELSRVANGYHASPVRLTGTGIEADLDILLGFDGKLKEVKANRFAAGRNDVAFNIDLTKDKPVVKADVVSLDLGTLVDALMRPSESTVVNSAQASSGQDTSNPPNIALGIKAKKVIMRGGVEAHDLVLDLDLDHGNLAGLLLNAALADGAMEAHMTPHDDGRRRVALTSTNMGQLVLGLSGFDGVAGGTGELVLLMPKVAEKKPAAGMVSIRDFHLINQSSLIEIAGAGSFTGISDLIDGNGIGFDSLKGDIAMTDDRFTVSRLRVSGPSAGISAEGTIDRNTNTVHAVGVFSPIHSLNTLLRCIPLLGEVLGGDDGILAAAFEVKGSVEAPDISISALSALAPGILRKLFMPDTPQ